MPTHLPWEAFPTHLSSVLSLGPALPSVSPWTSQCCGHFLPGPCPSLTQELLGDRDYSHLGISTAWHLFPQTPSWLTCSCSFFGSLFKCPLLRRPIPTTVLKSLPCPSPALPSHLCPVAWTPPWVPEDHDVGTGWTLHEAQAQVAGSFVRAWPCLQQESCEWPGYVCPTAWVGTAAGKPRFLPKNKGYFIVH